MSWLRALTETARAGLKIERTRLEPLVALRGAAGLAIVIALSVWALGPVAAVSSAFGAFQAAIATFQRSWRPRPELALASGTSLAVTTFLGYLTISQEALFLALLALWAFLAGLTWAAGPTIGLIASSNVAMMLVTVTLPTSVAQAAGHALIMVVGGMVQAALIVLFPIRRWGAHRDALADALAGEADYARRLRHDPVAPFDPEPLMEARNAAAVTRRQARSRPAELHGTRGLAERIRPVLASLADPAVGVPEEGPERARVRDLLAASGAILDAAAHAIRHGEPVDLPPTAAAAFRTPDTAAILTGPAKRAATRLAALLEDVIETAGASRTPVSLTAPPDAEAAAPAEATQAAPDRQGATEGTAAEDAHLAHRAHPDGSHSDTRPIVLVRPTLLGLVPEALKSVRKEFRRGSPVLRHALRVTVVAGAGYVIGDALPLGHGYWAPLTSVMIMRPDFSQTYSRAVGRLAGTLVGVAVATAIVQITDLGPYVSGALAVVCAGLMYLLMRSGQVAAQACVAAYVVFLLGMGGEEWTQTVPERVLLTLIGGFLAMLSYAVYPAWETPRLRTRLADWLLENGRYAAVVVGRYAAPAGRTSPDVREALLAARDARIAWQQASARARTEPVRHRGLSRAAADDAEEALAQMARVAMLMEAHLPERGTTPVPAAARLAEALRTSTEQGAKAVRERRVPKWDAVRAALDEWDGEGVPDRVVRRGAGLLLETLDELSDALDTAAPPMSLDGTSARRAGTGTETGAGSGSGIAPAGGPGNADGPRNQEGPTAR
ncbi:FUSC family protein [Streptomyces jeddahensis]|uniref:Inner membrane protein YccS n=1 Tax=Streptomyces jeddahensis TaxID=1716141 RepID=A0A177HLF1_9ACTN|nr:FUSC family protein [Streptomyces jeddahensis]OAH11380.1 inner membrane protein YccS [Streptomyces jeddahensis]